MCLQYFGVFINFKLFGKNFIISHHFNVEKWFLFKSQRSPQSIAEEYIVVKIWLTL